MRRQKKHQQRQVFIMATFAWWSAEKSSAPCFRCGDLPGLEDMERHAQVTVYDADPARKLHRSTETLDQYADRMWDQLSARQAAGDFSMAVKRVVCVDCALALLDGMCHGKITGLVRAHPTMALIMPGGAATVVGMIAERGGHADHKTLAFLERIPFDLPYLLRRLTVAVDAGDLSPAGPAGFYMLPDRTSKMKVS